MSISWGATSLGVTAPSGYLQESNSDQTIEIATIRDADGPIVVAQAKPRNTTTTTVKTKGEAALLAIPTGVFSGATCTSSKYSQTNDDFSTSEATYTLFQ
jgi:hypothetical protein